MQTIPDSKNVSNVVSTFANSLRNYTPQKRAALQSQRNRVQFIDHSYQNSKTQLVQMIQQVVNDLKIEPLRTLGFINKIINDPKDMLRSHVYIHLFNPEERTELGKYLLSQKDFWIILQIYFYLTHQQPNQYSKYMYQKMQDNMQSHLNPDLFNEVQNEVEQIKVLMNEHFKKEEGSQKKVKFIFDKPNTLKKWSDPQSDEQQSNIQEDESNLKNIPFHGGGFESEEQESDELDDEQFWKKVEEQQKLNRQLFKRESSLQRAQPKLLKKITIIDNDKLLTSPCQQVQVEQIVEDNLSNGMYCIGMLSDDNDGELLENGYLVLIQKREFDENKDQIEDIQQAYQIYKRRIGHQKVIYVPKGRATYQL